MANAKCGNFNPETGKAFGVASAVFAGSARLRLYSVQSVGKHPLKSRPTTLSIDRR